MNTQIQEMIGRVPVDIAQSSDEIVFSFADGARARFLHHQDCCEEVKIEDVNGDWLDLIGHPLLVAEERSGEGPEPGYTYFFTHETWTFYTFRSVKGSVDVRWLGRSNGYYSEKVDFDFTFPQEKKDG